LESSSGNNFGELAYWMITWSNSLWAFWRLYILSIVHSNFDFSK
jgi:hypothetical protein